MATFVLKHECLSAAELAGGVCSMTRSDRMIPPKSRRGSSKPPQYDRVWPPTPA